MKVKIKKLNAEAIIPKYSKPGDAGLDLIATSVTFTEGYMEFGTGLALEIPEGYVGLLFPRSSISETDHTLANSVGVIDSGYRGEVKLRLKYHRMLTGKNYKVGDKVGQLLVMPYPQVELEETTEELSVTDRGEGGFGSTNA